MTSLLLHAAIVAENYYLLGPLALRSAKLAISRAPELDLGTGAYLAHRPCKESLTTFVMITGLDFERAAYEPLLKSKDRTEALQAFKEKRLPLFTGE